MEQIGQQPLSPPISVHSEIGIIVQSPNVEFSEMQICDDMICDDCQMPKRYGTMAWWWDEQCVMNICEHCGMKKHRSHKLLRHSDAERRENDGYNSFLESTRSLVAEKLADFNQQKKYLDSVESVVNDVDRFQNGKIELMERFETTMQEIETELLILGESRLNHATYVQRKIRREEMNRVIDTVSTMLKVLQPRLNNLLAIFDELKYSAANLRKIQSPSAEEENNDEEFQSFDEFSRGAGFQEQNM